MLRLWPAKGNWLDHYIRRHARFCQACSFPKLYSSHAVLVEEGVPRAVERTNNNRSNNWQVAVFWDLNGCRVPDDSDPHCIGPNILSALRMSGFRGPVSIDAYCNTRNLISEDTLQALTATGIDLHHLCCSGIKDSINHLIVDLLLWVKQNPPPAYVFLITGDRDFSGVLHKVHMKGYDILWAYPKDGVSPDLLSATSKVWAWNNIVNGVGLVARSCINGTLLKKGHSYSSRNVCNAFESHGKPEPLIHSPITESEYENRSSLSNHDLRSPQTIPQVVSEQVLNLVKMKPHGFTLQGLRQALKSKLSLDKGFYGHKDLLSFLLAIPNLNARILWAPDRTRSCLFTVDTATQSTLSFNDETSVPCEDVIVQVSKGDSLPLEGSCASVEDKGQSARPPPECHGQCDGRLSSLTTRQSTSIEQSPDSFAISEAVGKAEAVDKSCGSWVQRVV